MKKTQKLKATVEDITFDTTVEKLPIQFHGMLKRLLESESESVHDVIITSGNASLFVQLEWLGPKPKLNKKTRLFGYEQDEFLEKQYK